MLYSFQECNIQRNNLMQSRLWKIVERNQFQHAKCLHKNCQNLANVAGESERVFSFNDFLKLQQAEKINKQVLKLTIFKALMLDEALQGKNTPVIKLWQIQ